MGVGGAWVGVGVGGTWVGVGVGVAEGTVLVGVEATSAVFVAAGAVVGALVGLGLGAGGFVDSGLVGFLVGEGSTSALATTLASGVGVSAI